MVSQRTAKIVLISPIDRIDTENNVKGVQGTERNIISIPETH